MAGERKASSKGKKMPPATKKSAAKNANSNKASGPAVVSVVSDKTASAESADNGVGGKRKKRSHAENAEETDANNAKTQKLQREIAIMILSVKTRDAALELAEKAFESASFDL